MKRGWAGEFTLFADLYAVTKGKLKQLQFKNTKNELRLPVHAMWLKGESLQKGAKELVELMNIHQPIVPNFD